MMMGETIRFYREKAGLTQEELAKLIGVSAGTVLNYEKGKTIPDVLTLGMIMHVTGIGFKELFHDDGDFYEPSSCTLSLYCPQNGLELDENGRALCEPMEITSNIFRLYNCRKCEYACVEMNNNVYLLYNDVEIEAGNMALVKFSGSKYFVIASFDGKSYTDIVTHETTDKIDAIAARVLGIVDNYKKHEKRE